MSIAEATPDLEQADRSDHAFLGHPKGLGYLGFTEACERFSYYSMQTLLVLYMVNYLLVPARMHSVVGLDWLQAHVYHGLTGQPLASAIFGTYASLVYLTPIAGGFIADKWLGRDATLLIGGVLMVIGHFLMAIEWAFVFALLALVLGVGAFKGNIASQVGSLYAPNDLRRATAFQLFYIFINAGVILASPIAGTLGQKVGWHWGFGCAGVVMVLGMAIYLAGRPHLPRHELATPKADPALREPLNRTDWVRIAYVVVLIPVLAIALLTNMQIFNVYLTWGDQHFSLSLFGTTFPSSWLITIDSVVSVTFLVVVAAFWKLWSLKHREPDEISKMMIGSLFSIGAGLCLFMGALTEPAGGKISMFWPLMFEVLNSIGFAHILPISLALFSKLAPRQINATVIGLYYLAFFLANAMVGWVGGFYSTLPTTTFWLIHVACAAFGLVAFFVLKLAIGKRMDSRPKDQAAALA
ncbi:peptide MFS transporter [Sphingomonas sp.]|uniref:peptide MFS transporter n=1 Tax=Sphingomonas sp. TaxID=28214 RepID=UPI0025F2487D|nr:peptide MFS transporter [Sphingomonas sp.]MBV9528180.1 peptide MFS transporter [Sphingomonas sp.]